MNRHYSDDLKDALVRFGWEQDKYGGLRIIVNVPELAGEISNGDRIVDFSFDDTNRWGTISYGYNFSYDFDGREYQNNPELFGEIATSIAGKAVVENLVKSEYRKLREYETDYVRNNEK